MEHTRDGVQVLEPDGAFPGEPPGQDVAVDPGAPCQHGGRDVALGEHTEQLSRKGVGVHYRRVYR